MNAPQRSVQRQVGEPGVPDRRLSRDFFILVRK
jgi:hypothetical protein